MKNKKLIIKEKLCFEENKDYNLKDIFKDEIETIETCISNNLSYNDINYFKFYRKDGYLHLDIEFSDEFSNLHQDLRNKK